MKRSENAFRRGGNYEKGLKEFTFLHELWRPGVHEICVCHDEWCDFYNHRGPCNCEPEFLLGSRESNGIESDPRDTIDLAVVARSRGQDAGSGDS
jgi:hypothetical protein